MLTFRKPTDEDIQYVADHMRHADMVEIRASHNSTPLGALKYGVKKSSYVSASLIDGVPCAIFGLVPVSLLTGTANPWLLGTDLIFNHKHLFVRETRKGVVEMLQLYPNLVNWVHSENTLSIDWLKMMGFSLGDVEPFGIRDELFHKFTLRRANV